MAISSTKSKNSVRTIQINDVVKNALDMQRKIQLSTQISVIRIPKVDDYGRKIGEISNLVFTQKNGNAWNEPSIIRLIHRIVDRQNKLTEETDQIKLMYFTPHMIRHTYTTMAFEAGADEKELAFRLGHASEVTTRDTYTYLRGRKKQEQEDIINQIRII